MTSISKTEHSILFAAGGTGGHIFPAVAVAEYLQSSHPKVAVQFTGTPERMESQILPELGYSFDAIPFSGWRGFNASALTFPFALARAVAKARALIKQHNCNVVVGTGSYISVPACLAAYSKGIPVVLLEANVNPGKANALLARIAHTVCISFEATRSMLSTKGRIVHTGNPVRSAMQQLPSVTSARQAFGFNQNDKVIFAFGGSLGAESINAALLQALPSLEELGVRLIWQTGKNNLPENANAIRDKGHVVQEFFSDMALPLAAADLIVSRSGGTTVAELTSIGKPSILVPMPHAANNEQLIMAELLRSKGACRLVIDSEVKDKLVENIEACFASANTLNEMAKQARVLGNKNASADVGELLVRMH